MSEEDYKALIERRTPKKPAKYRNEKKVVDGRLFDSTKEANRYMDLAAQQASGQITELYRQQPFFIVVNGHDIGFYVADFTYKRDGKLVVEDVKSKVTRKLPLYQWKKRLVLACHGIEIQEI